MTAISRSLCWAAVLIALALANAAGWIADKDANLMFVLIPVLWIAADRRRCAGPRQVAA